MNASSFLLLPLCSLHYTLKADLLLIIFETVFNIYDVIANRSSREKLGPFIGVMGKLTISQMKPGQED